VRQIVEAGLAQWYSAGLRAGLLGEGSSPGRGWEFFSSPPPPDLLWGPPILLSNGHQGGLSLGVKRPGREADHSPPTSAKVQNAWSYTSTPSIRLHGVVLSEAQNPIVAGEFYNIFRIAWVIK
jgi:hypothetical protein